MQLDTSPEAAATALRGILWGVQDAPELVEVSVKSHGAQGSWKSWHLPGPELWDPKTVRELGNWSRTGRDVYFGAVGLTGRPDEPWRRGGAGLRGTAGALWIDVDCKAPGRDDDEHFENVEDAVTRMDNAFREISPEHGQLLVDAALVIGSGWGVQYWLPLDYRVSGVNASRLTRVLCAMLPATEALGTNKIDRLWDVTRVFRMPGTWNWRAGTAPDDGQPTGVVRWPSLAARLTYSEIAAILLRERTDVIAVGEDPQDMVDRLLQIHCGVSPVKVTASDAWIELDEIPSIDAVADRVWTWEEILEPKGWRKVHDSIDTGGHEDVWLRPGKEDEAALWRAGSGERSAVVYADKPELLVVYSDSQETGFNWALRGGGKRGDAAGVGVVSKWRAYVDLYFHGEWKDAAQAAWGGELPELDAISRKLNEEMSWMFEAAKHISENRRETVRAEAEALLEEQRP